MATRPEWIRRIAGRGMGGAYFASMGEASSPRKMVLVVDDATDYLIGLSVLLEQRGFDAITAKCGPEALQILEHITPDIIVTDLIMPDMDGEELCNRIKADLRFSRIPVLLVSAVSKFRAPNCCFDAFMENSGFYDLLKAVEHVVGR